MASLPRVVDSKSGITLIPAVQEVRQAMPDTAQNTRIGIIEQLRLVGRDLDVYGLIVGAMTLYHRTAVRPAGGQSSPWTVRHGAPAAHSELLRPRGLVGAGDPRCGRVPVTRQFWHTARLRDQNSTYHFSKQVLREVDITSRIRGTRGRSLAKGQSPDWIPGYSVLRWMMLPSNASCDPEFVHSRNMLRLKSSHFINAVCVQARVMYTEARRA